MSVKRKSIVYNGFFSLLDKAYTALSNLALIPFIIHNLGMDRYGIWVVLVTISGYFALGHLGIPFSFEKYIAQYNARRDTASMNRFIATAFWASLILGIMIYLAAIPLAPAVFHLLLANDSLQNYRFIFLLLMITVSLTLPSMVIVAVPRGFQRYDMAGIISIIGRSFYIVAVVFFCNKGFGLLSLIAGQAVFLLITSLCSLLISFRLIHGFDLSPGLFDVQMFRMMLGFGVKMLVSLCAVIITQTFDKLVIAHYLGVRVVALYDIGSRLIMFIKDVPSFLYSSITPRTSELQTLDNQKGLEKLFITGTKYLAIICIGVIALLYPISHEVLSVWMRFTIDPLSAYVFKVLLVSTMFYVTTGLATSIGVGIGKPGAIALSNIVMGGVNIIGSVSFFFLFGAKGVVWGTATGFVSSTCLYYVLLTKQMNISQWKFWNEAILVPCGVNAAIVLLMLGVKHFLLGLHHPAFFGIQYNYFMIGVNCLAGVMLMAAAYGLMRYVTFAELCAYLPWLKKAPLRR